MTVDTTDSHTPEWFGSAARGIAAFPLLMGVYMLCYSVWWPFTSWPVAGVIAFVAVATLAGFFIARGIRQLQHASTFPSVPSAEDLRLGRAMGILNGVTHPINLIGSIVLLVTGNGRWVLPLVVVVIGAHFVPMAKILNRSIDYLLGPLMMAFGVAGAVLAADATVPWITVFAVSGIGGTIATATYAAYLSRGYQKLAAKAQLAFR